MIRFTPRWSWIFLISIFIFSSHLRPEDKTPAAWTILTYLQADNDLAPYANYNINDMEVAFATSKTKTPNINLLVQWDQPQNNKTWRYRITNTGRVEDESLNQEMGYHPAQEIVEAMKWVKTKYPAQKYALILWNHGSGVEDYRLKFPQLPNTIRTRLGRPWLTPPGLFTSERGILYDESQNTCLTNQGLASALTSIKQLLGKKLDILGMDACLMAMVEIAYQVKNTVNVLVASEETEPGTGWAYADFLTPVVAAPELFTTPLMAQNIVQAYEQFYTKDESDYSLSALNIGQINTLKQNIDAIIKQIDACKAMAPADIKDKVLKARRAAQTFTIDSYVDLYSFYNELIKQCNKASPKSAKILDQITQQKTTLNTRYKKSLTTLTLLLTNGLKQIKQLVIANVAGAGVPDSYGISIYYPNTRYPTSSIHPSYLKTQFAQDSKWLQFIKEYRNAR